MGKLTHSKHTTGIVQEQKIIQTFLNTNEGLIILKMSLEFERINRQNGVFIMKIRVKHSHFYTFEKFL